MAFSLCAAIRSVFRVKTRTPTAPMEELTLPLMGAKQALANAELAISALAKDSSPESFATFATLKDMMDQSIRCIEVCESIIQKIQYLDQKQHPLMDAGEVESLWEVFRRQIPIVALNLTSIQYYLSVLRTQTITAQ